MITELLLVTTALTSTPASAAEAGARQVAALASDLHSSEAATQAQAARALASLGGARAADALADFVHEGQPDAATDAVLLALRTHPFAAARPLALELADHRRARARRLAFGVLAQLQGAEVDAALVRGLSDSDAQVRGIAAEALGKRGVRTALPRLFVALERGVPEAAPAIGRLGAAQDIARYHDALGRVPLAVMLSGYRQWLLREDLAESTRVAIVGRLGEVATPEVKAFLLQLVARADLPPSSDLRHALLETAKRIRDERGGANAAPAAPPGGPPGKAPAEPAPALDPGAGAR